MLKLSSVQHLSSLACVPPAACYFAALPILLPVACVCSPWAIGYRVLRPYGYRERMCEQLGWMGVTKEESFVLLWFWPGVCFVLFCFFFKITSLLSKIVQTYIGVQLLVNSLFPSLDWQAPGFHNLPLHHFDFTSHVLISPCSPSSTHNLVQKVGREGHQSPWRDNAASWWSQQAPASQLNILICSRMSESPFAFFPFNN